MTGSDSSTRSSAPIRARPWKRSPEPPRRPGAYRFAFRLIGIPAAAVAGVLLYSGLRDRFVLPGCDSDRAKHTLADVLKHYQLAPARYEPITTVSSSKDEVVCKAVVPLPDGATIAIDYTFYWEGNTANMKYSISPKTTPSPPIR